MSSMSLEVINFFYITWFALEFNRQSFWKCCFSFRYYSYNDQAYSANKSNYVSLRLTWTEKPWSGRLGWLLTLYTTKDTKTKCCSAILVMLFPFSYFVKYIEYIFYRVYRLISIYHLYLSDMKLYLYKPYFYKGKVFFNTLRYFATSLIFAMH